MKNIYRVESRWSKELIIAKTIQEAITKYEKRNKAIELTDREVSRAELLGEVS